MAGSSARACADAGGCGLATPSPRAALVRVVGTSMQFFVPAAKRALAACLYQCGHHAVAPKERKWTISVEAVGSGAVLASALQVDPDDTVGALRAQISGLRNVADVRLFVGHGGAELPLHGERLRVRDSLLSDGATVVVAVEFFCEQCDVACAEQVCCACKTSLCPACELKCPACDAVTCPPCGLAVQFMFGYGYTQWTCWACEDTTYP